MWSQSDELSIASHVENYTLYDVAARAAMMGRGPYLCVMSGYYACLVWNRHVAAGLFASLPHRYKGYLVKHSPDKQPILTRNQHELLSLARADRSKQTTSVCQLN